MRYRRVLSIWFPRLAAERVLRLQPMLDEGPFAVVKEENGAQVLYATSIRAEAEGLRPGQPLRDAQAMCPGLLTHGMDPAAEAAFLTILRRWAGKFSPWVAEEPPASLVLDLTGCSHLFGGEEEILEVVQEDCAQHGLSVQCGIADTLGAAWALARFAGQAAGHERTGDAIDQEARATRSRAAKRRHWERGGAAPKFATPAPRVSRIAPPGQTRAAIAPLPLPALRLPEETVAGLARVGLRRIEDLAGMPRAALARRFGHPVVRRLDQASGVEPEPITPAAPEDHFAIRLTLPEPVGLEDDILAAIDRLLPPLCEKLKVRGQGARVLHLQCFRVDQEAQVIELGLARSTNEAARIRPLLALKIAEIDAGFGIDAIRLSATEASPMESKPPPAKIVHGDAEPVRSPQEELHDLIGKIGARIGLDRIVIGRPASTHIPEKAVVTMAAAWADPCFDWPDETPPRPLTIWAPEPVMADDHPKPPMIFRWRRRRFEMAAALGPERISPEWWLDDPAWRSGVRDYWRVTTRCGERLWLYFAHGGQMSSGWFCQGAFA